MIEQFFVHLKTYPNGAHRRLKIGEKEEKNVPKIPKVYNQWWQDVIPDPSLMVICHRRRDRKSGARRNQVELRNQEIGHISKIGRYYNYN